MCLSIYSMYVIYTKPLCMCHENRSGTSLKKEDTRRRVRGRHRVNFVKAHDLLRCECFYEAHDHAHECASQKVRWRKVEGASRASQRAGFYSLGFLQQGLALNTKKNDLEIRPDDETLENICLCISTWTLWACNSLHLLINRLLLPTFWGRCRNSCLEWWHITLSPPFHPPCQQISRPMVRVKLPHNPAGDMLLS